MASGMEILNQRLAAGEITEEEYDRLSQKISETTEPPAAATPEQVASPPVQNPAPVKTSFLDSGFGKFLQGVGGVVIVLVVLGLIFGGSSKGLKIGNITGSGTRVEFKVSNTSSKSEDMVFWIEQNGVEKCNRITRVRSGFTHTVKFRCANLNVGKYSLRYKWASSDKARARISTRIN